MTDDFCAFILTHGRPDKVLTYKTLAHCGYTGKTYIVIDNEDKTAPEYYKNFGDQVIMFDKKAIAETIDEGDNFNDRRAIIYARNACFDIAKQLGIKYFIQLDDDYFSFVYKYTDKEEYKERVIRNLDNIFSAFLDFYKNSPFLAIAFAQCGDFLGGDGGNFAHSHRVRKAMNSFICSTERPFHFFGRINEDVNTYTNLGFRGGLFLTVAKVAIHQLMSQTNQGGMTDLYVDSGSYIKSFYTVMYQPSSVKIAAMQSQYSRLHHLVSWKNTVPVILDEQYKK